MDEKTKREIIELADKFEKAEKLQKTVDDVLAETEWEDQEFLENFNAEYGPILEQNQKLLQVQYRQRLRSIKSDPALVTALERRGMSPEKFAMLSDRNPNAYAETYSAGIERLLDKLEGKDAKRRSDPFFEPSAILKPHPDNLKRARAIAEEGRGDDKQLDDMLAALLYGE
jgi:hypothetical protein